MRIFFDRGTPAPLRHELLGHSVKTCHEMGWSELTTGARLAAAETLFNLVITTDLNLRFQPKTARRKIAVIVLSTTNWPEIQHHKHFVVSAVNSIGQNGWMEIEIPT